MQTPNTKKKHRRHFTYGGEECDSSFIVTNKQVQNTQNDVLHKWRSLPLEVISIHRWSAGLRAANKLTNKLIIVLFLICYSIILIEIFNVIFFICNSAPFLYVLIFILLYYHGHHHHRAHFFFIIFYMMMLIYFILSSTV